MNPGYSFDPVDLAQHRNWINLSAGVRLQTMLHARTLAVGLIRGQLRKQYPHLSQEALNVKVLEAVDARGRRKIPRF